jgi:uncharacterized repeat protein (TIGR01451 family)
VTITATVTNHGPEDAPDVTFSDHPPKTLAFGSIASTQGACQSGQPVTCDLGPLASGATAVVTITGSKVKAGLIVDKATATGTLSDVNPSNDTDSTSIAGIRA